MTTNQANNNQNQPQNSQQGSLLRRVGNTSTNQNPLTNNQNKNTASRSRFGNGNRVGNNQQLAKPTWTITPMHNEGVKIAFQGIGDPLFRILGTTLDKSLSDVEILVDKLTKDEVLYQQLIDKLDDVWKVYDFRGATIMHPIRKNILDVYTLPVMPVIEPEQPDDTNNTEDNNTLPNPVQNEKMVSSYRIYRSIDAAFVLNILGRVRGNVLVEGTPLALEYGFLNQSYLCDDTRLVELAVATGAIEESLA